MLAHKLGADGTAYVTKIRNDNRIRGGTEEDTGLSSRTVGSRKRKRRRESLVRENYQRSPEVATKTRPR